MYKILNIEQLKQKLSAIDVEQRFLSIIKI